MVRDDSVLPCQSTCATRTHESSSKDGNTGIAVVSSNSSSQLPEQNVDSQTQLFHCCSKVRNSDLTEEQRREKRRLKMELKFRRKVNKLESRIRHARSRRDPIVEHHALDELQRLLLLSEHKSRSVGEKSGDRANGMEPSMTSMDSNGKADPGKNVDGRSDTVISELSESTKAEIFPSAATSESGSMLPSSALREKMKRNVMDVIDRLGIHRFQGGVAKTSNSNETNVEGDVGVSSAGTSSFATNASRGRERCDIKSMQNERATELLKHMTKGTQTLTMFTSENSVALRGYARRKFLERAMLLCESLLRLDGGHIWSDDGRINQGSSSASLALSWPRREAHLMSTRILCRCMLWDVIVNVRRVCSIGCGPGNDMVGLLAFLDTCRCGDRNDGEEKEQERTLHYHRLDEVAFLDWAVQDGGWRDASLDRLSSLLLTDERARTCIIDFCDVTRPITDPRNVALRRTRYDMFLTSYVLSETRGKWMIFIRELFLLAKPGAVFYFAEPTTWQLHRLMEIATDVGKEGENTAAGGDVDVGNRCRTKIDFMWIDSSMNSPALQALDGRVGPAVLLAMKRVEKSA